MNILVIEDEERIAAFVRRGLEGEGYHVRLETDGRAGLQAALTGDLDLVLLDLGLPALSGEDVLAGIRERRPELPVIVLSAKDAISDRVSNLQAGADDYLVKPFAFSELIARVQVRLRNSEPAAPTPQRLGRVELDVQAGVAHVDGRAEELSRHEVGILQALIGAEGAPVPARALQRRVWGAEHNASTDVVDAYVATLMRRLGEGVVERSADGYRMG